MLILGTANQKKGLELADLLRPVGEELLTLADFPGGFEVVEDGETFAANARLKAAGYARRLGQWVLADDSGLEVDALGGEPGVFSARYSGLGATDGSNNRLLLERLGGLEPEKRARSSSATWPWPIRRATSWPKATAAAAGASYRRRRGQGGFGYDPLFEIVEYHRTFAELGLAVKAVLSHRARAVCRVVPQLIRLKKT